MARGNLAYDQIATGSRQGNGTKLQMAGGGQTTQGHLAIYDGNGNLVDGGMPVVVSDTAPTSPLPGALWFDSVGQALYVRYQDPTSTQWVVAVNQPKPAYNWADFTLSAISGVTLGTITYAKALRTGPIAYFGCQFLGTVANNINEILLSGLPNVNNLLSVVGVIAYTMENDLPLLAGVKGNGQLSVRDPSKGNYPQGTWTFIVSGWYPAA